jgi:hypothetical protein
MTDNRRGTARVTSGLPARATEEPVASRIHGARRNKASDRTTPAQSAILAAQEAVHRMNRLARRPTTSSPISRVEASEMTPAAYVYPCRGGLGPMTSQGGFDI